MKKGEQNEKIIQKEKKSNKKKWKQQSEEFRAILKQAKG